MFVMKKLILIFSMVIPVFIGCGTDSMESFLNMDNSEMEDEMEITFMGFAQGNFVSDAHTTTGTASVNDSKTVLSLTNFMTDEGPKLLVYLSTDKNSTDFVNLGDLKSVSGSQSYNIPSNTDLTKYKVVSIWCVDFLVSFGHAELK